MRLKYYLLCTKYLYMCEFPYNSCALVVKSRLDCNYPCTFYTTSCDVEITPAYLSLILLCSGPADAKFAALARFG